MIRKKEKLSAKGLYELAVGNSESMDDFNGVINAYKYENDEFLKKIDEMSEDEAEYPFLFSLKDWPDMQKDKVLSFSLFKPEALEILYQEEGNPLFVWRAYKNCRKHNLPIPDWVLRSFDDSADNLLNIEAINNPAGETYGALGLNRPGSGTEFKRFDEYQKKLNAVCMVIALKRDRGKTEFRNNLDIYAEVAERFLVEIETIKKWCGKYKYLFN
jgi:hypothetical protein